MIPLERAFHDPRYKGVVGMMGSQMGKTDSTANIIGQRVDDDPVPVIYVGPTKHFVEKKWEPRFEAMVNSAASLLAKKSPDVDETKSLKHINGVNIHFVWGGSASSVAGQEAGLVIVDERDRMGGSVDGEGDIVELANARHETYADGKTGVFSTPTTGTVEPKKHPVTGLEHWQVSDQISSPTWQLWQQGTRHEWMVPCPHCSVVFAPRLRYLVFPRDVSAGDLNDSNVKVACPHCGALIDEAAKISMNERGVDVSPGQTVENGVAVGEGVRSDWYTLWVSGLCSPWRSWVTTARRLLRAEREGSSDKLQAVINTAGGELYAVSGEAPPVTALDALKLNYESVPPEEPERSIPGDISEILLTVDVQMDRLYYVIRGWTRRQRMKSFLLDAGEIQGDTLEPEVWEALGEFKGRTFGDRDLAITRCFVDQKYRAPAVFSFCQSHRGWAFPIAGRLPRDNTPDSQRPLQSSSIDLDKRGKRLRGVGLLRWTLNTDFFKRWIHDRINLGEKGGFLLPRDVSDDYCRQLVAEARVVKPSGQVMWIAKGPNHYLDCEMMQVGCAYSRRLQHFAQPGASAKETPPDPPAPPSSEAVAPAPVPPPPDPPKPRPPAGGGWMGRRGRRWMR